mmetsp:Transcript_10693/g.28572  ORF Transcript_10693/g.28572 Transcript_10693/m.28572 type:complete len:512 (-) Transcript_10693:104-1639(-)
MEEARRAEFAESMLPQLCADARGQLGADAEQKEGTDGADFELFAMDDAEMEMELEMEPSLDWMGDGSFALGWLDEEVSQTSRGIADCGRAELPSVDRVLDGAVREVELGDGDGDIAAEGAAEALCFGALTESSVSCSSDVVSAGDCSNQTLASVPAHGVAAARSNVTSDGKLAHEWQRRAMITAEENAQLRRQLAHLRQQNRALLLENEGLRSAFSAQYLGHQQQPSFQLGSAVSPERSYLFGVVHVAQDVAAQLQAAAALAAPVASSKTAKKATGGAVLCCVLLCFGLFLSPSLLVPESAELAALDPALASTHPALGFANSQVLPYVDDASTKVLPVDGGPARLEAVDDRGSLSALSIPFADYASRYAVVAAGQTRPGQAAAGVGFDRNVESDSDVKLYAEYLANLKRSHALYADVMGEESHVVPSGYIMCGDVQSMLLVEKNGCDERGRRDGCDEYVVSLVLPARALGLNVTANDGSFAELNCAVRSVTQFGMPVRAPTGRVLAALATD